MNHEGAGVKARKTGGMVTWTLGMRKGMAVAITETSRLR